MRISDWSSDVCSSDLHLLYASEVADAIIDDGYRGRYHGLRRASMISDFMTRLPSRSRANFPSRVSKIAGLVKLSQIPSNSSRGIFKRLQNVSMAALGYPPSSRQTSRKHRARITTP